MGGIVKLGIYGGGAIVGFFALNAINEGQRNGAIESYGLAEHEIVVMDACIGALKASRQEFVGLTDEGKGCGCLAAYSTIDPALAGVHGKVVRDMIFAASDDDAASMTNGALESMKKYADEADQISIMTIWADVGNAISMCAANKWEPPVADTPA